MFDMKNRNNQASSKTDKEVSNAGSAAFNQGVEQDPNYDDGTKVSDEEKLTKHSQSPGKEKQKSKEANIGKNNTAEKE